MSGGSKGDRDRDQREYDRGQRDAEKDEYHEKWGNPFESHERIQRDADNYKRGHADYDKKH
jgi:hypothetical protein